MPAAVITMPRAGSRPMACACRSVHQRRPLEADRIGIDQYLFPPAARPVSGLHGSRCPSFFVSSTPGVADDAEAALHVRLNAQDVDSDPIGARVRNRATRRDRVAAHRQDAPVHEHADRGRGLRPQHSPGRRVAVCRHPSRVVTSICATSPIRSSSHDSSSSSTPVTRSPHGPICHARQSCCPTRQPRPSTSRC